MPRAGEQLGEPPADVDVRLVHADHEALVQVAVDLLVDRRDDLGRAVAEVLAADAAREVEVGAPVVGLDAGALGADDDERRRGRPRGTRTVTRLAYVVLGSMVRHANRLVAVRGRATVSAENRRAGLRARTVA